MPFASRAHGQVRRRSGQPRHAFRRALALLLVCGHEGCSEHVLRAHGFTIDQLAELVRAGLATVTPQRVRAGRETLEVTTLWITAEGRKALGTG